MTKTVNNALDAMLALYAKPGTWTQRCGARNAAGEPVPATDPLAVSWDIGGAIDLVVGSDAALVDLVEERIESVILCSYPALNDDASTTLANVVDLLNRARDRVAA